jgi:hypothetical protein
VKQLDKGIGDTLVLALEVPGSDRRRYQITLTRFRHGRRCDHYPPLRASGRGGLSNWIRSVERASAKTRKAHRRDVPNAEVHTVNGRAFGFDTAAYEIAQMVRTSVK